MATNPRSGDEGADAGRDDAPRADEPKAATSTNGQRPAAERPATERVAPKRTDEERTCEFLDVFNDEAVEIWRRRSSLRRAEGKPEKDAQHQPPTDLVGLALSGGGIRAASVGLGALQALYNDGERGQRLREIDYLSTVSGGGYIGGYLSSAAVSTRTTIDKALANPAKPAKAAEATGNLTDFGQPSLVQRLIYGGKYLIRPWEAANKYLIGLFFINLVLFSALLMFSALAAFAWRMFDYDGVRDFLDLFNLNSGVVVAFLPFYFFLACWTCAWLLSYFKYEAEAPGTWAQRWLYLMVGSLLIGVTVLIVTPQTNVGFLRVFTGHGQVANDGSVSKWLLALLGASLVPLLAPKTLVRLGLHPRNVWERVAFRGVMCAMLVGVPLTIVGILAKPNISDTARDPNDNLRAGDIYSWPAFLAMMKPEHGPLDQRQKDRLQVLESRWTAGTLRPWVEGSAHDIRELRNLTRFELATQADELRQQMVELGRLRERIESVGLWERFVSVLRWPMSGDDPLHKFWDLQRKVRGDQKALCQRFSEYVLSSKDLPRAIVAKQLLMKEPDVLRFDIPAVNTAATNPVNTQTSKPATTAQNVASKPGDADKPPVATAESAQPPANKASDEAKPTTVFKQIGEILLARQKEAINGRQVDSEDLTDADLSFANWGSPSVKEFNLQLLWSMNPETFFDPDKVYRQQVIDEDQTRRAWILGGAALVFLVAGALVNVNSTSLHRFYRNRVRHAYLVPYRDGRADFPLSSLGITDDHEENPAPYHLINATIDLSRPRFLDEVDAECRDEKADRRDVQTFIFSKKYCGCDATGWIRTEHYESFREDNINVADAIALSGSALSPQRAPSLGLMAMMSVLNLNLGQWMPNPRFQKPRLKPNFFVLLKDWIRNPVVDSTYCYVSDGGFSDNLGIMSLLRRRCRLIIAVDATCDSKRAFVDLNGIIRAARIRFGIQIEELGSQKTGCEKTLGTDCLEPDENGICQRHFLLGRIKYPGDTDKSPPAWLVYLKPSFTGDEGADLLKYRAEAAEFPHDDTSNQFYEPARVEAYRQLGFHITDDFLKQLNVPQGGSMLEALKTLENALVSAGKEAEALDALQHELPQTAKDALGAGKELLQKVQQALEQVDKVGTQHDQEMKAVVKVLNRIQTSLAAPVEPNAGRDARKQFIEGKTGAVCKVTGLYKSVCSHSVEKNITKGRRFPPCLSCDAEKGKQSVAWRLV